MARLAVALALPAAALLVPAAGAAAGLCSPADVAAMGKEGPGTAAGTFPELAASCGSTSWSIFSGFNTEKYATCLAGKAGISSGCASCFAGSGKYGFDNCKTACLTSWCSSSCLSCVGKYHDDLVKCTGAEPPAASPCLAEAPAPAAGQCSAADLAAMAKEGPGTATGSFPEMAAACGSSSWSIFSGWLMDKYTSCLEAKASISHGCAQCFGGSGKYGFDNCKGACLTSWCSTGCLSCVGKYHDDLVKCVGAEPPAASACYSEALNTTAQHEIIM